MPRRPGHPQLGQPRGRRGARAAASTGSAPSPREYGAAVICLLIDEEGQARDVEWKMRVAHRIHDLADPALRPRGRATSSSTRSRSRCRPATTTCAATPWHTIEAIRRIKAELPGVHTTLGVSNVSLRPQAGGPPRPQLGVPARVRRRPASTRPSSTRPASCRSTRSPRSSARSASTSSTTARDEAAGYDPLAELLDVFADVKVAKAGEGGPHRLAGRGAPQGRASSTATATASTDDLDEALAEGIAPLAIINDILLAGMKVVGELFGSGQMQLPFVLQSAETMKASVAYLEPHMEKVEGDAGKGRIVLATVKGDVHDIGKNLVDIILTNNGYEVHNLGIKVGIAEMIEKALEVKADAIGMSGLLVKSHADHARQPRGAERPRAVEHPGAARRRRAHPHLRRARPARRLRRPAVLRQGRLRGPARHGPPRRDQARRRATTTPTGAACRPSRGCRRGRARPGRERRRAAGRAARPRRPTSTTDNQVFVPPFVGSQVVKGIALDDIAGYLNETALFRNQWQFRPEKGGERRRRVQGPHPADAARRSWPRPRPTASSSRRSSTATSRPTATATTS